MSEKNKKNTAPEEEALEKEEITDREEEPTKNEKADVTEIPAVNEEKQEEESEKKPVKPRKRRITKNIQMYVTASITGAALLFIIMWGLFFNQSLIGTWTYEVLPEETADSASTADEAAASGIVAYEFKKNGECISTYGSMSINGTYQIASTKENGNVVSISTLYGTYAYKITGNAFTGRKLEMTNLYFDDDELVLKKGRIKDPLTPYENAKLDERLNGKWYDAENDITYEFNEKGEMFRTTSDGFVVRHYYTVMQTNQILAKFCAQFEDSRTYGYEFDGETLYIDGFVVTKMDK